MTAVAKAELHVHLEGTAPPELVRRIADAQRRCALPEGMLGNDGRFRYTDFLDFLRTYDLAASVIRTGEDYRDITYEYLCSCARGGAIYVELTASPDHAALVGLSDEEHLGRDRARDRRRPPRHRHRGADPDLGRAQLRRRAGAARRPPRRRAPPPLRRRLLDGRRRGRVPGGRLRRGVRRSPPTPASAARSTPASGREPTASAPRSSSRSPGSPTASGRSRTRRWWTSSRRGGSCSSAARPATSCSACIRAYEEHPLPALRDAGVRVTLGSDDPPYFGATIEGEYEVCADADGLQRGRSARDHRAPRSTPRSATTICGPRCAPRVIVRSSVCGSVSSGSAAAGAIQPSWKPKTTSTSRASSPPR